MDVRSTNGLESPGLKYTSLGAYTKAGGCEVEDFDPADQA